MPCELTKAWLKLIPLLTDKKASLFATVQYQIGLGTVPPSQLSCDVVQEISHRVKVWERTQSHG